MSRRKFLLILFLGIFYTIRPLFHLGLIFSLEERKCCVILKICRLIVVNFKSERTLLAEKKIRQFSFDPSIIMNVNL